MTKQITTESGIVLLLVEVPDGIRKVDVVKNHIGIWLQFVTNTPVLVPIPQGNWQGKHFKEMSESQCLPLVDSEELFINGNSQGVLYCDYRDVNDVCEWFSKAIYSMESLIRSHGFDPETTVVLIKQSTKE